jgi:putative selenium metabolism hydrolase
VGEVKRMARGETLWSIVRANREGLIAFAQQVVRTKSLPGEEGQVASLIQEHMRKLGYNAVWVDEVGNVIGRIDGGEGPSVMLNGHMDHVHASDPGLWPHPPYGGEIHEGELWGRGSVDMKGALVAMVYAGGALKTSGLVPPGDVFVSGVVQEEVGGLGARHLSRSLPVDRAVVGEASGNQLRRGHRGRIELRARFEGRSVHASMPDKGVNPHYSMARFVTGLDSLRMADDPVFGVSTVAPTVISCEPASRNVTPTRLEVVLDWRNIPREREEEITSKLEVLLERSLGKGCSGRVGVATKALTTYTGYEMTYRDCFPSFTTDAKAPYLLEAKRALQGLLERPVEVDIWPFATDGGHFAAGGATVIGFGPGDAALVHTADERLPLTELEESVVGYAGLCLVT